MKRTFILTILIFMFAVCANAQVSTQNARRLSSGTAVPSGACTVGPPFTQIYIRTTDQSLYECTGASTWTKVVGGGTPGTVTSVSVTTANGVSGSVATATTTPAITLTLGAITPSSVTSAGLIQTTGAEGSQLEIKPAGLTDFKIAVGATGLYVNDATNSKTPFVVAPNTDNSLTVGTSTIALVGSTTVTGGSFGLTGAISGAGIFGTSGIRYKNIASTLTDTTSSGTVATHYTNIFGNNTLAATNATTITNAFNTYVSDPVQGTNVTLTNKWAIGGDSMKIGTSNQLTVSNAGAVNAPGGITATLTGNATTATDTASKTGTGSIYVTNTAPQITALGVGVAAPSVGIDVRGAGGGEIGHFEASSSGTSRLYIIIKTTGSQVVVGAENSAGGQLITGGLAYAGVLATYSNTAVQIAPNATATATFASGGAITWTTGLTNASGTPGSLCYNTSTFEMTKNNALTCTVSNPIFKQDITDLPKTDAFSQLRPVQFAYKDHPNRKRWGFLSTQVAAADRRLADGYDAEGRNPMSLDQNAILALTVKKVQDQQNQIEQLRKDLNAKTITHRRAVRRHARAN